jgi:UDP-N-acetylmuramyl pentapeptide synthase
LCFPDADAATSWIAQIRPSDCIILLKGSRSASLETLLPLL